MMNNASALKGQRYLHFLYNIFRLSTLESKTNLHVILQLQMLLCVEYMVLKDSCLTTARTPIANIQLQSLLRDGHCLVLAIYQVPVMENCLLMNQCYSLRINRLTPYNVLYENKIKI